jgi:GNAT superfamily N-acetyltransferase
MIAYEWRGAFKNSSVNLLHAEAFGHDLIEADWLGQVTKHSLGWVCATQLDELVGFVNVAWDGGSHAFILDTVVALRVRRMGVGIAMVATAAQEVRTAGCEWLHVDYEENMAAFYLEGCGFTPTRAGLIHMTRN